MECSTEVILELLVAEVSKIPEVQSVGISGGKLPLPRAGDGDIDIFIYCDMIPELDKRHEVMAQLGGLLVKPEINALHGGHWGEGDFAMINGVETWLMYFTLDETMDELDSILKGELPDKLDNYYYPVGRCAMFTRMGILYDKNGYLKALKEKLNVYPDKLAEILIEYHLGELEDTEDLERAAGRKDILFYHFALDIALDHFLQALFALNRVFFPSRKRSLEFMEEFEIRPVNCGERLLEVISLGSSMESIGQSYKAWSILVNELRKIITLSFLSGNCLQ
ncbi:MAG: DUF4037 domain-containing protein [Pseudomonadota bacterium]